MEFHIDPEFQNKIPPLTQAEFDLLEQRILKDGAVERPLVVWKSEGILVDGHNRWRIIQSHPELPYTIDERDFADKWEAFEWMYENQLGQRNLSDENQTYCWGKLYEARKHTHGGDRKSSIQTGYLKNQQVVSIQNGNLAKQRVSEQLAEELHIGKGTVLRAAEYAKGIDTIREQSPELADAILKGETKATKEDVRKVGKASEANRTEMIDQIKQGQRVTPVQTPEKIKAEVKTNYNGGGSAEYRERRQKIAEAVESMYDDTPVVYTLNDLFDEIRWNAESYISLLANIVESHSELIKSNAQKVKKYISENVTMKIKEIEEEI
jgi:hypothetical protein